jgi:hypothetical protein
MADICSRLPEPLTDLIDRQPFEEMKFQSVPLLIG